MAPPSESEPTAESVALLYVTSDAIADRLRKLAADIRRYDVPTRTALLEEAAMRLDVSVHLARERSDAGTKAAQTRADRKAQRAQARSAAAVKAAKTRKENQRRDTVQAVRKRAAEAAKAAQS